MESKAEYIVVIVETAHIQPYIFGSNRLKENVAASYLVAAATDHWAKEAVIQAVGNPNHNINFDELQTLNDERKIERDRTIAAEVIYAGGGNFAVIFRGEDVARNFTRILSQRVLREAAGLRLTINDVTFDWSDVLCDKIQQAIQGLKMARAKTPYPIGLAGLGVTVMCQSTSLPAVDIDPYEKENPRYISGEVKAKLEHFGDADVKLREDLLLPWEITYPRDFDKLGRSKGESSYIAVVHADGNGMGQMIREIGKQFKTNQDNRKYIQTIRAFSEGVKKVAQEAMQQTVNLLLTNISQTDESPPRYVIYTRDRRPAIVLEQDEDNDNKLILPLRPLVSGGDDMTFVCDGRLGISLANAFVRYFEAKAQIFLDDFSQRFVKLLQPLTACVGVAIVKVHYPFARAYDLSEDLCQSAKKFKKTEKLSGGALDWHFTPGGIYDEIDEMRKREYRIGNEVDEGRLTLCPVSLREAHEFRNWSTIERVLTEFQMKWFDKRNKSKALRDALRGGQQSVALFVRRYEQTLPLLAGFEDGWRKEDSESRSISYCGYADALELMDLYIPLSEEML